MHHFELTGHILFHVINMYGDLEIYECQGFILAQKYSCQICIILATGCQNSGRLNRRLPRSYNLCKDGGEFRRMNIYRNNVS